MAVVKSKFLILYYKIKSQCTENCCKRRINSILSELYHIRLFLFFCFLYICWFLFFVSWLVFFQIYFDTNVHVQCMLNFIPSLFRNLFHFSDKNVLQNMNNLQSFLNIHVKISIAIKYLNLYTPFRFSMSSWGKQEGKILDVIEWCAMTFFRYKLIK